MKPFGRHEEAIPNAVVGIAKQCFRLNQPSVAVIEKKIIILPHNVFEFVFNHIKEGLADEYGFMRSIEVRFSVTIHLSSVVV